MITNQRSQWPSFSERQRLLKEEELHIPRGQRGSPQNLLRALYPVERCHGWKIGRSANESLQAALADVHQDHSDYSFQYDAPWFVARG